jgi:hypothetical protein
MECIILASASHTKKGHWQKTIAFYITVRIECTMLATITLTHLTTLYTIALTHLTTLYTIALTHLTTLYTIALTHLTTYCIKGSQMC